MSWCPKSPANPLFFTSLLWLTRNKISKFYITDPFWGESTSGFPSQRVSNVENISMSWHHHDKIVHISYGCILYWDSFPFICRHFICRHGHCIMYSYLMYCCDKNVLLSSNVYALDSLYRSFVPRGRFTNIAYCILKHEYVITATVFCSFKFLIHVWFL